jgi:hypothetical protein
LGRPDGSISTEESFSFNEDGKEILIPSIVNGQRLSEEAAIGAYHAGRNPAIGTYDTPEEANAAGQARSDLLGDIRSRQAAGKPAGILQNADPLNVDTSIFNYLGQKEKEDVVNKELPKAPFGRL